MQELINETLSFSLIIFIFYVASIFLTAII